MQDCKICPYYVFTTTIGSPDKKVWHCRSGFKPSKDDWCVDVCREQWPAISDIEKIRQKFSAKLRGCKPGNRESFDVSYHEGQVSVVRELMDFLDKLTSPTLF